MGTRGIGAAATQERALRDQALRDAAALFHEHGAHAIALVSDRLIDQSRTAAERRCDRLTLLAVERLDRERRLGSSSTALVAWKPPLFSVAGIARLFGIRLGRRGQSRRK